MLFTCLDSVHQGSKIFFIIPISYLQVMAPRKRARLPELSPDAGLSEKAGTEERCSRNLICSAKSSQGTSEVDSGEPSTRRRSNTRNNSEIPPSWPWQPCVSIAAGLLLAGLLALTQAWCVNSLHENLLWFSELTVRAIRDRLPVWDTVFLLKREITSLILLLCEEFFHVLNIFSQVLKLRKFRLVFAFNVDDKQYVYLLNTCGGVYMVSLCPPQSRFEFPGGQGLGCFGFLPQPLNGKATS